MRDPAESPSPPMGFVDTDLATSYAVSKNPPQCRLRGPPTPNMTTPSIDFDQATRSHPPPPTPAPSPGPAPAHLDYEDVVYEEFLSLTAKRFTTCASSQRTRLLSELLSLCTTHELSYVFQFVSPMLKKDPFMCLPDEICLRILSFIDDPVVLARASQVSHRWRYLVSDDMTWKNLCVKHNFYRAKPDDASASSPTTQQSLTSSSNPTTEHLTKEAILSQLTEALFSNNQPSPIEVRRHKRSYKAQFKERYLIEAAWRSGGTYTSRNITQHGGVVTNLQLTSKYIVMALDNAKIHVFDADGSNQRILQGHIMGVWAMVPWGDTLVSGGCDRDVRVWNMAGGYCLHTFRGHTSTVRCLKMADAFTAISGSRDTTIRIWDLRTGACRNVLSGHQASVRCLQVKGDIIVSGSYDTTVKVWSMSQGTCLKTLQGHFSQIYALAFDGVRVATGSLDTNVRIWDINTGECLAILQGHTSLVGQLQIRGDTLVSGGSDGSVRVWSLEKMCPIHRLAAHDNSVTSLQFDDRRIVSGGSDGRVKVWDLKTGTLVRDLIQHSEAVWRVAFQEDKCVVLALRNVKTVMEVWSFAPPEELLEDPPLMLRQRHFDKENSRPARPVSALPIRSQESLYAADHVPQELIEGGPSSAPPRSSSFFGNEG